MGGGGQQQCEGPEGRGEELSVSVPSAGLGRQALGGGGGCVHCCGCAERSVVLTSLHEKRRFLRVRATREPVTILGHCDVSGEAPGSPTSPLEPRGRTPSRLKGTQGST